MNWFKNSFSVLFLLCLAFTVLESPAEGQVSLSIVDAPESTLIYSPTFITAAIKNDGDQPLLVPKDGQIELSKRNEHVASLPDLQGDQAYDDLMWLRPKEKYLFQYDVGRMMSDEGIYEVRAIYHSPGECRILRNDSRFLEAKRVSKPEVTDTLVEYIQCWGGELRSEPKKISVSKPIKSEDLQALDYVLHRTMAGPINARLAWAYLYLKEVYPNSYYTYVAGLYRTEGSQWETMEDIMRSQPNHPLAVYAKVHWAIDVILDTHRSEPANREALPKIVPSEVDVPKPLQEYIAQVQREVNEWQ